METEDKKELLEVIKNGIEKLEEIANVKWSTYPNCKLTKEKLINGIHVSILDNRKLFKILGYASRSGVSMAMKKAIQNIPNRPINIHWNIFILELAGYKTCCGCKELKLLSSFSKNKNRKDGRNTYCFSCSENYNKENKEKHKERDKKYYQENKADKLLYRINTRRETVLHIIEVMIREGKLPECSVCGYKENWAALEFHHVNPKLDRPEWAYDIYGSKKGPGEYILNCKKETAEKRYLNEIDNLELLCANCHIKHHSVYNTKSQEGLKQVVEIEKDFCCEKCEETKHLDLHHNNTKEKETSFGDFCNKTKDEIIKNGALEKELNKDVSILCRNHHREYHFPQWRMINLLSTNQEEVKKCKSIRHYPE